MAAGLLTGLAGALFVTVSGTGTIAAMLTAPWLRNWLYHGHPLSGVSGLRLLLRGNPATLAYSHQITAAADAPPFLIICIVFPLIALVLAGFGALSDGAAPKRRRAARHEATARQTPSQRRTRRTALSTGT